MSTTFLSIGLTVALFVLLAAGLGRLSAVRASYELGLLAWARWLPVVATGVFLAVLAVNLAADAAAAAPFHLGGSLTTFDVVIFFFIGPLFLTRLGALLATAALVHMAARLAAEGGGPLVAPLGLYLLLASATLVALLADKMPWHSPARPSLLAHRWRELLLFALTVGAISAVFSCMIRLGPFGRFLDQVLALSAPRGLSLAGLTFLLVGWLSVAIGYGRSIVLPLLSLPTLFVVAHVTGWPLPVLVVPFAACLALALAAAERPPLWPRRAAGFAASYVVTGR